MALLYKKRTEGNAVIFDYTTKTKWVVLLAIPLGFALFVTSIKLSSSSPYAVPIFLISLPIFMAGLGFAVVENMIYLTARMNATRATMIKKGVIKLEGKMAQN